MKKLEEIIAPGITTLEIDRKGEEFIRNAGCIPSFKGYEGYPASICVSINDEVVHGIPSTDEHVLFEGDIVSLDAGVIYKEYQSDAARTHGVGKISEEDQKLIDVTKKVFSVGSSSPEQADICTKYHQQSRNMWNQWIFSIVRELVGHGIGREMHEDPQIPNFKPIGRGIKLCPV